MKKKAVMVDTSYVSRFVWDEELGKRLRHLRGKTSRGKLAEKAGFSMQFIQKLEWANPSNKPESIDRDDAIALCNALEVSLSELYPSLEIDADTAQKICNFLLTVCPTA